MGRWCCISWIYRNMKNLLILCVFVYGCQNLNDGTVNNMADDIECYVESFKKGEYIRYNLDASCSVCITEAINFVKAYEKSKVKVPCHMYVEKEYKEILLYYFGQFVKDTRIKMIFIEEDYPFGVAQTGKVFKVNSGGEVLDTLML